MGRVCNVCRSLHRTEYEHMRFVERKSIKEIQEYAKEKYGEDIGYYSFVRHFNNHVEVYLNELRKSSQLRQKVLRESIRKDIQIAQRLTRNLEICSNKIESLVQSASLSKDEEKVLLDYLAETRLIIEELLKWSSKIQLEPAKEDIFTRILYCMEDFPPELIEKFRERWENFGSSS